MDFQTPDTDAIAAPSTGGFVTPDHEAVAPPKPDEGALMAAGRGALRNVPLAQQAVSFMEPGDYAENLKDKTVKAEASKAAHPWAYGAGAVTGAAAPAIAGTLIPPLGAAMAASYPAAMASGAAIGAAQAISDTPLNKEPEKAAKEVALGGGMGALGGAAGKWVSSLFPTAVEAEAGVTAQKLGIPARRLVSVLGKDTDEGLVDIAKSLRATELPNGENLISLSDNPSRFAGKVSKAVDMYGKQIGNVVSKIDADIPMAPIQDTIKGMAVSDSGLAVRNEYLAEINKIISANADKEGNFSFGKLRDLTNHIYRDMVIEDPQTGRLAPGSEKALEAWRFLRGYQDDIVKAEQPELYQTFTSANKHFSNLVGLQKSLHATGLREEVKQAKPTGMLDPLSWGRRAGQIAEGATGLGRVANNLPFQAMPAINAMRGKVPGNLPQAELADYLTKKFGKEK